MGLFQPSSPFLPAYPDGGRGAIREAGPPSTESAAADEPVHAEPASTDRIPPAHGPAGLPSALCVSDAFLGAHERLSSRPVLLATPAGSFAGPGRPLSGGRDTFRGNENKPLRAHSNRKSNDSRKRATLSEPITSNFLIATKTHFSEEKAKSEEKTNLLNASKTILLGMDGR
jgi:hypothetical protein